MPPPATDTLPASPPPARAGSSRRDPAWLLGIAAVLLVLRVVLGIIEERKASAPDRPATVEETPADIWLAGRRWLAKIGARERER